MRSLSELNFRRKLCLTIIEELQKMDDSRKGGALEEYERQLASLDQQIAEADILAGHTVPQKPPPTVVNLKTAVVDFSSQRSEP